MTSAATCDQKVGISTFSARNTTEPSGLRISLVVSRNSMSAYADWLSLVYLRSIRIFLPHLSDAGACGVCSPDIGRRHLICARTRPDPRFYPVDPARHCSTPVLLSGRLRPDRRGAPGARLLLGDRNPCSDTVTASGAVTQDPVRRAPGGTKNHTRRTLKKLGRLGRYVKL